MIHNTKSDLETCRDKIMQLLEEYNCSLHTDDSWANITLVDNDTHESVNNINPVKRG